MKKKILAVLLAATLALSLVACGSEADDTTDTNAEESTQEEDEGQADDDSSNLDVEEITTIELIAGEQGDYGKQITMNEGTDMEESFFVYYVPAGTYEVTNEGEYMTQISVYEGFTRNEESGYDEYTNTGDFVLLDVEKTAPIEIPDGWFIEIQEPTHISLTLTDSE